jgi:hypothetical protein
VTVICTFAGWRRKGRKQTYPLGIAVLANVFIYWGASDWWLWRRGRRVAILLLLLIIIIIIIIIIYFYDNTS